MALPIDYDTVQVRGKYVYLDGSPATGFVRFSGKLVAVSDATNTIIMPATITATLDANGQFVVNLPATNDPNIQPNGFTYTVSEQLTGGFGRTYDIDVPLEAAPGGIDLSDVAPIAPANGSPTAFVTLTTYEGLDQRVSALEANGGTAGVSSVNSRTGAVTLTSSDVGLSNVDNTSDANKPVSAATQTALNAKADATALTSHTSNTANPHSVTKAQVGLGNADNTSDANKPVSTAQQTALNGKVDKSTLTTKGDIYVATAAGTVVRVAVGADGQVLTADSTTAPGVAWKAASGGGGGVTSVNSRTGAVVLAKSDVGLSNVDNTSDASKPISTATQTALDGKVDESVITAKGDLIAGTAASTVARLGLGTNGQYLVVDTTTATGMKWATLVSSNAVTSVAGRTGDVVLTKSDVGLANVDNTSDVNKPISSATQTALNAKADTTAVLLRSPTSVQTVSLDGTFTWLRGEVPYSAGDNNADQLQMHAAHSDGTTWIKTFWLNGNYEARCAPSTDNRIAFRVFEIAQAISSTGSKGDVFQVSTNPTSAASREALVAVRGTGASSLPGWLVATRGVDAPNLKAGSWVAVTYGAGTAPSTTYESPASRLEPNGLSSGGRVSLKGRVEIPANTAANAVLFTIADATHRPAKTRGFSIRTGPGSNIATIMEINSSGQAYLIVASGASAGYIYLDEISFAL